MVRLGAFFAIVDSFLNLGGNFIQKIGLKIEISNEILHNFVGKDIK